MTTSSTTWLPAVDRADRMLTSATLDEGLAEVDRVTLSIHGLPGPRFEVPTGQGAKLLTECGLQCELRREVPMIVAQLLADCRLGQCSGEEIDFLDRHSRVEPDLGIDELGTLLLWRRASSSGSDEDRQRLSDALRSTRTGR